MKIIHSINQIYINNVDTYKKLKEEVDKIFLECKDVKWHYFSRVKELESFALKLETGRVEYPKKMEDFFASTIVVENLSEIENAVNLIKKHFYILKKKPASEGYTYKHPCSFPYDDLRLYVKLKKHANLPENMGVNLLSDLVFEIQIKTFLQHAWAVATHDLTYKTDEIDWGKQRVSFQIKAMLEHAEISIQEANKLKESKSLKKENEETKNLKIIKKFLTDNLERSLLPENLIGLSKNLLHTLNLLNINRGELESILKLETQNGRGFKTQDLSPYFIILQSIINQKRQKIEQFISNRYLKGKLVLPKELDLRDIAINSEKIILI